MTATLGASRLATPPKPQFPRLEHPLGAAELEQALRSFSGSYYVQHPFHQLMYEGKLSQRQFQGWVANRLAYQRVVPRKDAAILSNCPDPAVRREWLQRIVDQAVGGGGGVIADRALRSQDPPAADRGISPILSLDSRRGAGLLQEPPGAGAPGRAPRAGHRSGALPNGGDPAARL